MDSNPIEKKSDEVRTKIAAVLTAATETDKAKVKQIIDQAKLGHYESEMASITPGMAALLFIQHNPYNRDWKPTWSLELFRRLETRQWEKNGDTIRFYDDGILADGQNRLAAIALNRKPVDCIVVYGLTRPAMLTIDGGKPRYASDAGKLEGVTKALEKERVLKAATSYLVKSGDSELRLRSEVEVSQAMKANNDDLGDALAIASTSEVNIVKPTLPHIPAATLVYLMIKGGWPKATIAEKLQMFQTGVSEEGSDDPFFVAARLIEKSRNAVNRKEHLSITKELAVAVYAMQQKQRGIKALSLAKLREAVKKEIPAPVYKTEEEVAAA